MYVTAVCIDAMPAFSNNNVQVALPATVVLLWASQGFSCCSSNNNAGARKKRKAQRIRWTTTQASIFGTQHLQKQLVHWVGIDAGPIWASSCSSYKQQPIAGREKGVSPAAAMLIMILLMMHCALVLMCFPTANNKKARKGRNKQTNGWRNKQLMSQTTLILLDVSKREQSCSSSSASSSKAAVESSKLTAVLCVCVFVSLSLSFSSVSEHCCKSLNSISATTTDETPAKPAEDSQTNGNINTNLNPNQKKSEKFSSYSAMAPRPQSKLQSSWGKALGGKAPWEVLRTGGEIYPQDITPGMAARDQKTVRYTVSGTVLNICCRTELCCCCCWLECGALFNKMM